MGLTALALLRNIPQALVRWAGKSGGCGGPWLPLQRAHDGVAAQVDGLEAAGQKLADQVALVLDAALHV